MLRTLFRWPLLLAVLALAGAAVAVALNPRWIRIEEIALQLAPESNQELLFQRIKSSLDGQLAGLHGRFFWQVPLSLVYETGTRDKRVKRISIYREFPSRLRVEIEPHTPVLAYLGGGGKIFPVATDATLLPPVPAADAPDLPLLRGEELKNEAALREAAIDLYNRVPADGALNKKRISEITYNKKDGFVVFVSGAATAVKMGDTDFGPKISRVAKVLSYLESQNIKGRVIDARFAKKVVVRVRNTP